MRTYVGGVRPWGLTALERGGVQTSPVRTA
jgi:hypothetical protein